MVTSVLGVTPQAVRSIVGELGLREMTRRGGFGRGGLFRIAVRIQANTVCNYMG
jgi:HTH DNA binding domain